MDYEKSFAVSAAGMSLERKRVEVSALNLANANVAIGPDGQGFRPMRVVAQAAAASFGDVMAGLPQGPVASVLPVAAGVRQVLDPGHPLADSRGFVAYPAVDPAAEMVSMMGAMRSYEANVAAMNIARSLALKTLEIGGK